MDNLVEDFAVRKLSKEVRALIKKMNMHHYHPANDMDKLFRKMMERGRMNRRDLLFLESRILLNRFCREFEEVFGEDLKTGFLFSCVNQKRILYGAGATYPESAKQLIAENDWSDYIKNKAFDASNEYFYIADYENTSGNPKIAEAMVKEGIHSGLAYSLHYNDFFMGAFAICFPYKNGKNDEILEYLREYIPSMSSELYHIRNELAVAVEDFEDKRMKKAIE